MAEFEVFLFLSGEFDFEMGDFLPLGESPFLFLPPFTCLPLLLMLSNLSLSLLPLPLRWAAVSFSGE